MGRTTKKDGRLDQETPQVLNVESPASRGGKSDKYFFPEGVTAKKVALTISLFWFDVVYGDIHLIFLDGRFYRTKADKDKKRPGTMLGKAQLQWLLETLRNSKAKIIVIIAPAPWVGGNPDKWNGFPEERETNFSHIEKHKIEGVVLMFADRHRSDLLMTKRKNGYDLYEFMSSRLTNVHAHGKAGPKEGALFSYNKECSFGMVHFDTTKADPEITYQIINIDNEEIFRFQLKRSQLTFKKVKPNPQRTDGLSRRSSGGLAAEIVTTFGAAAG